LHKNQILGIRKRRNRQRKTKN